ncbi:MAG: cation transporter [Lachnospiraceae bacterium]|nr:cation transporter [Lachnospiraceae bacterium]
MITLLSKVFIKTEDEKRKRKLYGTLCSIVGIVLNVLLFAGKMVAGFITGSVAITADAFNNLSDAGSSFITLIGFVFAGKKADTDHPFGHGRFEYLSGLFVSMIILMMGFELLKSSINKIIRPVNVSQNLVTIIILIVCVGIKLYMAYYNKKIGKRISSKAMMATGTDSLSDAVATTVVLLSMLFMELTGINIDGYCGVFVAGFILYAGINAAKDTIDPLLGVAPDKEFVKQVEEIVMSYDMVGGIHDMVVHDYGPGRRMVSLHAEVPGNKNIYEIHDTIDIIEERIRESLDCEAVIHMDPVDTDNEEIKRMKKIVSNSVKEIDERLSIHDFRMVSGPTHTNLIFDVVVPFEIKLTKNEVKEKVEEIVSSFEGNYFAVIKVEQSYV